VRQIEQRTARDDLQILQRCSSAARAPYQSFSNVFPLFVATAVRQLAAHKF
jgi:hypothetical protein